MLRELVNLPVSMARAAIDLPRSMQRSVREANDLMEVSRKQLEVMRRQADQALEQAERMNELLTRVVKLTEPIERAQRGGEYVGERLKRAIFGEEGARDEAAIEAEIVTEDVEQSANDADRAREKADEAPDPER